MKKATWMIPAGLLVAGLAAGFAAGKITGFATGSEWALQQADILAREAGVFMPVSYDGRTFRVVIKQPRGIYRKAHWLANQREKEQQSLTMNVSQAVHDLNAEKKNAEL